MMKSAINASAADFWRNPFLKFGGLILACAAAVVVVSPGIIEGLFRSGPFMPHATCYLRNPQIIMLHVSSDLLIGFSYVAISTTLAYLVYKASKDIPFQWMFLAFGLFIITCGFTHFMEVWTVWQAVYWLAGGVKLVCAAASVTTAIALYRLVPDVFALIGAVRVSEERRMKLESANAELEAFAYSVSHDLRAPLRAVQGLALALSEDYGEKLEPEARDYVERITSASRRMDSLIRDLLEYSRISRTEVELAPVDIQSAIAEARAALNNDEGLAGAEIKVQERLPTVIGNHTLLTQVLTNLLENAAKFVAPGVQPLVQVAAQEKDRTVRISVHDNGIGIPPEHREKIFKVFERLHSSSEYPGTGIGLAIVKKAMTRMRGELGFESVPGKGSCFWIELPKASSSARN
jgi:signal transduction histidine kinase